MYRRIAALMMAASTAWAAWPEFRGPTAQGITPEDSLPLEWSDRKNVAWKVELEGRGWSSPVHDGGLIFLTSAIEERDELRLMATALEATSGEVVWETEIFSVDEDEAPRMHQKNSQASPTPILHEGLLYVHFGHFGTACLKAGDGGLVWRVNDHPYRPVHGNGGSPLLWGDLLIYNADGAEDPAVIALNRNTGATVWKRGRESDARRKFSFATPLLIEVEGRPQIITPGSGVVQALEPTTGIEIWRVNYDQGYSVVPRPVFAEGRLFVATGYDQARMLAIRVDGSTGDLTRTHVEWEISRGAPHNPSAVVVDGLLYMVADSGILSCIDVATGREHYRERCTGPISASILAAPGRLYLTDEQGLTVVVEPGTRYRELARNDIDERTLASLAVIHGDLLLRTEEHLYRLSATP